MPFPSPLVSPCVFPPLALGEKSPMVSIPSAVPTCLVAQRKPIAHPAIMQHRPMKAKMTRNTHADVGKMNVTPNNAHPTELALVPLVRPNFLSSKRAIKYQTEIVKHGSEHNASHVRALIMPRT